MTRTISYFATAHLLDISIFKQTGQKLQISLSNNHPIRRYKADATRFISPNGAANGSRAVPSTFTKMTKEEATAETFKMLAEITASVKKVYRLEKKIALLTGKLSILEEKGLLS